MKEELRRIMDREGLEDWKLERSSGGWITFLENRRIILKNYNHFSLFLHEVAHAKVGTRKDKTGHDSKWADEYTDLVNKYMVPNKKLIKLFKNKLVSWKP